MSKLKELQRRSTIAWSVSSGRPDLIAAGTMAGTVGLDFDTSAQLEVFSLDLENSSSSLSLVGKTTSSNMFHKIVWGQSANGKYGILAGGMDNGTITIWDPAKISTNEGPQSGCIGNAQKHKGPVQALDFNPFQQNLLASGATDSEIFIWDLGKPADPTVYTPGAKPQQSSDIASVAWNKKVQHILASTQFSGVTVIWDLKAKRPVLNLADRNSKARSKAIAWHPTEATQVLTASEEDDAPVLQMWDLRNALTPSRTYTGHTRGVWGVSWSPFDTSLVLSCGKDNRTLCWHVETGEVLCEVESSTDSSVWNFDVQWSPRIPAVLSTSSLEGKVNIYALQDVCERTVIASDAFGGAQVQSTPNQAAPKHTPGWLQRPCGVAFGFGGKLVSFEKAKDAKAPRTLNVTSVVTEKEILDRSEKLEEVISTGRFTTFCDEKIASAATEEEKSTWSFLRVLFDTDARHKILNFLGFDESVTQQEIKDFIKTLPEDKTAEKEEKPKTPSPPPARKSPSPPPAEPTVEETPAEPVEPAESAEAVGDEAENQESKDVSGLFGPGGDDLSFSFGQPQTPRGEHAHHDHAHDHAHHEHDHAHDHDHAHHDHDHDHDHSHDHDHAHHHDHDHSHSHAPKKPAYSGPPIEIPTSEPGAESAITKALLIGNFEAAVQCCLRLDRVADALILAASGGPELWARTQEAYFARQTHSYARVMSAVVRNDLQELVEHSVLRDWKATLATLCTYTKSAEFPKLCSALGDRLDQANDAKAAILCYICAGSIDKAVGIWVRASGTVKNPHIVLQDLVEKISIFRQAVGGNNDLNDQLASKYSEYAGILAAQGRVQAALRYLSFLSDPKYSNTSGAVLLDRVYHSSAESKGVSEPPFPFKRVQVYSAGQQVPQQQAPQAHTQAHAPAHTQAHTQSHTQAQTHGFAPVAPSTQSSQYNAPYTGPSGVTYPPHQTSTYNNTSYPQTVSNFNYPEPTHGTHSSNKPSSGSPSVPPPPYGPATTFSTPGGNTTTPIPPVSTASSSSTSLPRQPFTPFDPTSRGTAAPPNLPAPTPHIGAPPVSNPPIGAPPVSSAPIGAPPVNLPPVSSAKAAPPKEQTPPPSGDAAFVITSLQQHIDAAGSAAQRNPALKPKFDDMSKRFPALLDRLAKNGVSAPSVALLTQLANALNAHDTAGAQSVLVQLTTGTNDIGAGPVIGIKHLIALSK